jgi:hypothetical protein
MSHEERIRPPGGRGTIGRLAEPWARKITCERRRYALSVYGMLPGSLVEASPELVLEQASPPAYLTIAGALAMKLGAKAATA